MPKEMKFTREEFYELVWSEPTVKLAKRFGMSDVAIAKICRKFRIPKPYLGYWAQRTAGGVPRKSPLPAINDSNLAFVRIHVVAPLSEVSILKMSDDSIEKAHPLIRDALEKINEPGAKSPWDGFLISGDQFPRALMILDSVFKSLEQLGCSIEIGEARSKRHDYEDRIMVFAVRGEDRAGFGIFERATGLAIYINEWVGRHRPSLWYDRGNSSGVEKYLPALVATILETLENTRVAREKREIEQKEEERVELRVWRSKNVAAMIYAKEHADKIRSLVAELESVGKRDDEFMNWSAWAREYADSIDPVACLKSGKEYEVPRFAVAATNARVDTGLFSYDPFDSDHLSDRGALSPWRVRRAP